MNEPQLTSSICKNEFQSDVIEGLSKKNKTLPCKYFYDKYGSELFEKICTLDEYYLTRTENALLDEILTKITTKIGSDVLLVEPGSGAGEKVQKLIQAMEKPAGYIPLDISKEILHRSTLVMKERFPNLPVFPKSGDFTVINKLTHVPEEYQKKRKIIFFPGSTIGNFTPSEAVNLLEHFRKTVEPDGGVIVGVDLIKKTSKLEAAYDDSKGITAKFNKNILSRINRELGGTFALDQFKHHAFFNSQKNRIEMHLVSLESQDACIAGQCFHFSKGESIHTENSHKYSMESFTQLAEQATLKVNHMWTDPKNRIALFYLQPSTKISKKIIRLNK